MTDEQAVPWKPNELIITVGLPRSGKSTWARAQGLPIVSPDAIRLATHGRVFWAPMEHQVWATAWQMVAALFNAGCPKVIVDACHTTDKRQRFWESPGMGDHHDWPVWKLTLHRVQTPKSICLERCGDDKDMRKVIERMALRYCVDHLPLLERHRT